MAKEHSDQSVDLSREHTAHPKETPDVLKDRSTAEQVGEKEMDQIINTEEVKTEHEREAGKS